jgi:predicted nucleic acid-binding protein
MAKVFWDTNLFIYLIEDAGPFTQRVFEMRERMIDRRDRLYTSALTVGELLVKPGTAGARDLEQEYLDIFRGPDITVVPFEVRTAPQYARLRRERLSPPDAIQLACAATAEVDLFITNDDHLSRTVIPEIKFICSLARAPI